MSASLARAQDALTFVLWCGLRLANHKGPIGPDEKSVGHRAAGVDTQHLVSCAISASRGRDAALGARAAQGADQSHPGVGAGDVLVGGGARARRRGHDRGVLMMGEVPDLGSRSVARGGLRCGRVIYCGGRRRVRSCRSAREEFNALMSVTRCWRDRLPFVLMRHAGLRRGEAVICWEEDLHFVAGRARAGLSCSGRASACSPSHDRAGLPRRSRRSDRIVPVGAVIVFCADRSFYERDGIAGATSSPTVLVNVAGENAGKPLRLDHVNSIVTDLCRRARLERRSLRTCCGTRGHGTGRGRRSGGRQGSARPPASGDNGTVRASGVGAVRAAVDRGQRPTAHLERPELDPIRHDAPAAHVPCALIDRRHHTKPSGCRAQGPAHRSPSTDAGHQCPETERTRLPRIPTARPERVPRLTLYEHSLVAPLGLALRTSGPLP